VTLVLKRKKKGEKILNSARRKGGKRNIQRAAMREG
jgi:hypothetical protein